MLTPLDKYTLTIFFDGKCPLCAAEMNHLKQIDYSDNIVLFDLHHPELSSRYPEIEFDKAMKILHASYQGKILLGLDVTHRAWSLVGKGFWVAPLNWPLVKQLSHLIYLFFAKNRQTISAFAVRYLGLKNRQCHTGTCYDK